MPNPGAAEELRIWLALRARHSYLTDTWNEDAIRLWFRVYDVMHETWAPGQETARKSFYGYQIMFVLAGRGTGRYRGRTFSARAGQAVCMDLRHPHQYAAHTARPWELCWVRFDGPGCEAIFQDLQELGGPVLPFDSRRDVLAAFRAIASALRRRRADYDLVIWQQLTGLVGSVYRGVRRTGVAGRTEEPPDRGVDRAIGWIRAHAHETVTLEALAKAAGMSPFQLIRKFRRITGTTPIEYLEHYRISRARQILGEPPGRRIKEIATTVGYPDQAYFSRKFKALTGMGPRAYRAAYAIGAPGRRQAIS